MEQMKLLWLRELILLSHNNKYEIGNTTLFTTSNSSWTNRNPCFNFSKIFSFFNRNVNTNRRAGFRMMHRSRKSFDSFCPIRFWNKNYYVKYFEKCSLLSPNDKWGKYDDDLSFSFDLWRFVSFHCVRIPMNVTSTKGPKNFVSPFVSFILQVVEQFLWLF